MEHDQIDPQGQSNPENQQNNQPSGETTQNEINNSTQTPGADNQANAERTDKPRNYSEESSDINTPALDKTSETKTGDEEKKRQDQEEEVKEMPHPHKRQIPESDDDFKHDM